MFQVPKFVSLFTQVVHFVTLLNKQGVASSSSPTSEVGAHSLPISGDKDQQAVPLISTHANFALLMPLLKSIHEIQFSLWDSEADSCTDSNKMKFLSTQISIAYDCNYVTDYYYYYYCVVSVI